MLFREGLRSGLERLGSLDIVAAASPEEALAFVQHERVDVVILDASRRRSLEYAATLGSARPGLKLVAFGICSQQDMLAGAEFGISAFVGEDGEVADINRAAMLALRGECHCSPTETARLIEHIACLARNVTHSIDGRLTDREREVASMVGRGLSNKAIAQELRISPATVKNHVHNILEKSNLPSRSAIGGRLEPRPMRRMA
jgi:DNA-binding NarL/FixJ family response regulator